MALGLSPGAADPPTPEEFADERDRYWGVLVPHLGYGGRHWVLDRSLSQCQGLGSWCVLWLGPAPKLV